MATGDEATATRDVEVVHKPFIPISPLSVTRPCAYPSTQPRGASKALFRPLDSPEDGRGRTCRSVSLCTAARPRFPTPAHLSPRHCQAWLEGQGKPRQARSVVSLHITREIMKSDPLRCPDGSAALVTTEDRLLRLYNTSVVSFFFLGLFR